MWNVEWLRGTQFISLLPYKCPTTSVQLLHFGVKCRNFAIVNKHKNLLPRQGEIFSCTGKKNDEFGMWNGVTGSADNSKLNNSKFKTEQLKIQN